MGFVVVLKIIQRRQFQCEEETFSLKSKRAIFPQSICGAQFSGHLAIDTHTPLNSQTETRRSHRKTIGSQSGRRKITYIANFSPQEKAGHVTRYVTSVSQQKFNANEPITMIMMMIRLRDQ